MYNEKFEEKMHHELAKVINGLVYSIPPTETANPDSILEVEEEELDEEILDKITTTVSVLSHWIGQLAVNYAILTSDDPSLQNANVNYYGLLKNKIAEEICEVAQKRAEKLI